MNKMYHVFSEGENVLFRENSDYIFFNNKFAFSIYTYQLQALAETTMSTHFHSIVETADEKGGLPLHELTTTMQHLVETVDEKGACRKATPFSFNKRPILQ